MNRLNIYLLANDFTVRIVEKASSAKEFALANASCTFFCCFYMKNKIVFLRNLDRIYSHKISIKFSCTEC